MELYLIRHGETDWNAARKVQGQVDIPLNENGRRVADETGRALRDLRFDRVYSSPLLRALETARLICAGRSVPIEADDRLKEIDFGPYEGRVVSDLQENFRRFSDAPELYRAPEGAESIEHLMARSLDFLESVLVPASLMQDAPERVLVVAHGAWGQGMKLNLRHAPIADFWKPAFPKNCSVSIFDIHGHSYTEIADNRLYYRESDADQGILFSSLKG